MTESPMLEMWGGVECTVNRVGDRYVDQLARTGHAHRLEDIDRFADLGVRALRVPILWEHVQPDRHAAPDWWWPDRALARMRERGVRPIVGLLHHGFGPGWIDIRESSFAAKLAHFARMVAERYPWVEAYTPVNEPLTTARFSALYGHWFPHARDAVAFARVLIAQIAGVVRAMREIRAVNPSAQLVQTEDLGQASSTPALEYQRDFENERRWLTWDLLCGTVTRDHPCWSFLRHLGHVERELDELRESPCPPDIIGINHYVTSERHLDERVERYALDEIGGNGRDVYADVAMVQVDATGRAGAYGLIRQAWSRYRLPIAVTECHLGCTREEQMRWLKEVWDAAQRARREGADVRAVTSWALLGSYDWDSLVTRDRGHYEPGAFDVRAPTPRPTALATMIRALATNGSYQHPVLEAPGWWERGSRDASSAPVLIAGAGSPLGRALTDACRSRGLIHDAIEDERIIESLDAHQPWLVIDARCDTTRAAADARACATRGVRFAALLPDRLSGEQDAEMHDTLLVATGLCFGAMDASDPLLRALETLASGAPIAESEDRIVSPAFIPDLVHAALDLAIDGERGVCRLANGPSLSLHELIARAAQRLGISTERLARAELGASNTQKTSERGWPMPSLDDALDRWAALARPHVSSARSTRAGHTAVAIPG